MEYLIQYHRLTGRVQIQEFEHAEAAYSCRLRLEQERTDPNLEIAVIGAPSFEDLKLNHSRYFASASESAQPPSTAPRYAV